MPATAMMTATAVAVAVAAAVAVVAMAAVAAAMAAMVEAAVVAAAVVAAVVAAAAVAAAAVAMAAAIVCHSCWCFAPVFCRREIEDPVVGWSCLSPRYECNDVCHQNSWQTTGADQPPVAADDRPTCTLVMYDS